MREEPWKDALGIRVGEPEESVVSSYRTRARHSDYAVLTWKEYESPSPSLATSSSPRVIEAICVREKEPSIDLEGAALL